jgi:exopolyphosphatase / guanosine-5'-triphosphate,3'-diphosphate pyrophosphatase
MTALSQEANQGVSQGRLPGRRPVAVVDIGSNSVRLVIYEGIARAPTVLFNEKMLAGLGKGLAATKRLDPEAVTRALAEFRRFRALADQSGAAELYVIATAAAREAENGTDFIRRAEAVLGTEIRVLSGREEAYYSALGVISGFHPADGIAGDLGGGSLELVDVKDREIGEGVTLPLGGLRLQDMAQNLLPAAARIAREALGRAALLKGGQGRPFYAVGGTWRNLARLHISTTGYPLAVMHNYEMDVDGSADFLRQVAKGDIEKIKGIEQVSRNRRALLPYGATVLQELVAQMKPSKILISALGVREGFLYSLLPPEEQLADPLLSAASEFAVLRSRSVAHARELVEWTAASFAAFGIDETQDERRLRQAACLLADIGWRAHPEYRGTQSLNIIAHASFIGVDHPGRVFLALANLFRHEGLNEDAISPELRRLAPPRYLERARLLGAMFRVVYLFSAAMPGVMPRMRWEPRGDGSLTLVVPKDHAGLNGERPAGRVGQLARVTGRKLELAAEGD